MIQDHDELVTLLDRVMADYREERRFFANHRLPEYDVLNAVDLNERTTALYLTFTCTANHIHNERGESKQTAGKDGLWWVCYHLLDADPWLFAPDRLVGEARRQELTDRFADVALMDSRDPDWWYRVAATLHGEFDSDPRMLLEAYDHEAPKIETAVTDRHDFPGLGGPKICPLWLRLMNDEVHPLEDLDQIDLPVDIHVVNITGKLRGEAFDPYDEDDKDTVRTFWRVICDQHGFTPVHLDIPIWLLHKYWGSGGREYVETTLRELRS